MLTSNKQNEVIGFMKAPVNVTSHPEISNFGHSVWTRTGQKTVACCDVSETVCQRLTYDS